AGKSSIQLAAGSVIGFYEEKHLPNFRITEAALEELTASFNDHAVIVKPNFYPARPRSGYEHFAALHIDWQRDKARVSHKRFIVRERFIERSSSEASRTFRSQNKI
ncbi:MAG: hypothetical protein WA322_05800, partial [Pseudolabrys sp.]